MKTVVYYTSNREDPVFEERIQQNLYDNIKGVPLISVSQKPIDFGKNICVGDVGTSNLNVFRQIQIGVRTAETKFICLAEADYLHPKEYFEYEPEVDDIFYCAMPIYVLFMHRGKQKIFSAKKRYCEGAIIVGKDFLLKCLDAMLEGQPMWMDSKTEIPLPYLFKLGKTKTFFTTIPLVTFKTDSQLHRRVSHRINSKTRELPHWGTVNELIRKYFT